MSHGQVADRLEAFIREQFGVAPEDRRFGPETALFERGYVDSIGVAELVAFIEEEFGVSVPDEYLLSDDFDTVDGIARIVCHLGDGKAAVGRLELESR